MLIGALFNMALANKAKLAEHDVLFAENKGVSKKLDDLQETLERHEEREERQFTAIHEKLEKLVISVALIKKTSNGDKVNA